VENRINVLIHFVWATWNRTPILTREIERPVYRCIYAACVEMKARVIAIGGFEDHVHLLVSLPSTVLMADLMQVVKGRSSRLVTDELLGGEWFQWQGSYGAFSVSPHDKERVVAYIRAQKERHAAGALWPNAERSATVPEVPDRIREIPDASYDHGETSAFDSWYSAFLNEPAAWSFDDIDPFEGTV
jgi:putative transposase